MYNIQLTDQEMSKVSAQTKSDANLPTYYNAQQRQNVKISRDFEAFLILSTSGLKRQATLWIQQIQQLKSDNKDRDTILSEAIKFENTDATAQMTAYATKLNSFDSFRKEFSAGKFASVAEVSTFLGDLQLIIAEMISQRDRSYYNQVFSGLLTTRISYDEETSDKEKQLKSWLK